PTRRASASFRAEVSAEDRGISVDAPVAQERPIAARLLDQLRIALRDEYRGIGARFGENPAERIGDERIAEKLDAVGVRLVLMADTIRRSDVHAVRDGMRALHRAPRVHL